MKVTREKEEFIDKFKKFLCKDLVLYITFSVLSNPDIFLL